MIFIHILSVFETTFLTHMVDIVKLQIILIENVDALHIILDQHNHWLSNILRSFIQPKKHVYTVLFNFSLCMGIPNTAKDNELFKLGRIPECY